MRNANTPLQRSTRTVIIVANIVVILGYVLFQTITWEEIKAKGETVLFKLRPVDPRSLMQGDYMILRYDLARRSHSDTLGSKGYLVYRLDDNGVAVMVRYQEALEPLASDESVIAYTFHNGEVTIGSESFFFEEGSGETYAGARYGRLRVDERGNAALVGLNDAAFEPIP